MSRYHNGQRQNHILAIMAIGAIILIVQAFRLQIVDQTFKDKANAITIDKNTIFPSRGLIFDRNNKLLVTNATNYDIMVTLNSVDPNMDTLKFCELLAITKDDFKENLKKDFKSGRYSRSVPFIFLRKLSIESYAIFQEHMHEFPGFSASLRNIRSYPHQSAAHILGYISEVSRDDIEKAPETFAIGDYKGTTGLELYYESLLRGSKGYEYLLRDNLGRTVGSYLDNDKDIIPESGVDLHTGLDLDLQAYGEQLMQHKTGSIIALEPKTGEVLTMISAPFFDPNMLVITKDRGRRLATLINDKRKPFFDRAVMAKYPPGSIFKSFIGLIALEDGINVVNTGHRCNGGYQYGDRLYKCHDHPYPANIGLAMKYSCNTYFFKTLRDYIDQKSFYEPTVGLDRLVKRAKDFNMGRPLGIDFPHESAGFIPTSRYYDSLYPKKRGGWKSPTIMSIGIGQGEVQLTTLQMANLAAIIANRGYYYTPHIVKSFSNGMELDTLYSNRHRVDVEPKYFEAIIDGMEKAVESGTATRARTPGIRICGKTGTSQNPHGADHSVFFAFAPRENPKIAIAVYVENAGFGGAVAAPIASLIIEKYLNDSISTPRIPLQDRISALEIGADQ